MAYTTLVAHHWVSRAKEIIHANLQRVTADGMENARWKNFDKTFRLSVSQTLRHFLSEIHQVCRIIAAINDTEKL